ncbi:fatty acid desaturase [Candidatus Peregrinibacteria bacterium]|nr:fatty acid desaturase [Candidatus Peregrinibacteria bacterium]
MSPKKRWGVFWFIVGVHILAFAAVVTFTWEGLFALVALWILTGMGITIGYHRCLTHRSFKTWEPIRLCLALLGMSAGQGTIAEWVSMHIKHHVKSDTEEDPHSPHYGGFLRAHIKWLWEPFTTEQKSALFRRYGRHIVEDPTLWFLSEPKVYIAWMLFTIILIGLLGFLWGGPRICLSVLVYGVVLRLVVVYHITWLVNSATHLWGYRSFDTDDDSRNNWIVALLAHGEGWHNNHHANQMVANHGQRWWELDTSKIVIRLLAFFRLARNVYWYNVAKQKVEVLYRSLDQEHAGAS